MLHQANFLLETGQNYYFINSSLKRSEQAENTEAIVNPRNSFTTEADMSSYGKPVPDDNLSAHMNASDADTTELDISSSRKSNSDDKLNSDSEFSIDAKFPKATVNERQTSLKLINASDLEVSRTSLCQPAKDDLNELHLSVTQELDSSIDAIAGNEIVVESRTCLFLPSSDNAGHVVRDIPVDEGTSLKDKQPLVFDCSDFTEEIPNSSLAKDTNFFNHSLETTDDQLKMIAVNDNKDMTEWQGSPVIDVQGLAQETLAQLHQHDKGILEESFVLQSSGLEEKHVCNPVDWNHNTRQHELSSKSEYIGESSGSSTGKLENEDCEKDRESAHISEYQEQPILVIPVKNTERDYGHDFDACYSAYCLDVRLQSSSAKTQCLQDNPVETTMEVQLSVDHDRRMESLGCGSRSDECLVSHDIYAGESSGLASDECHSIESSVLKGQNTKDESEFPSDGTLEGGNKDRKLRGAVDNTPLQENSFLISEDKYALGAAESSVASARLRDVSAINLSSSDMDFAPKDVFRDFSTAGTGLLETPKIEKLQDSFLSKSETGEKGSREQAAEQKPTVVGQSLQSLPVSSHSTKECNKTCNLTENILIDPEVTNCEKSQKSVGDTISASALPNINAAAVNNECENQIHDIKSGFSGHPDVERKTEESMIASEHTLTIDDQNASPLTHSRKEHNGTYEMSEKLVIDSMETSCSASEKSAGSNVSAPAFAESDTKKTGRQRNAVTSGFTAHAVSSVHTGQDLLESFPDGFDDVNGNNDMAESAHYTYSGPISLSGPISGPISYSGPIPFSGSISLRSDSSTTSTRSFAFPILASEWNSSPVKMAQADPRYYRKKRGWQFLCFCGGASATR